MSQDDYKAGLGGAEWSPGMNREDYDAGVAKRNYGKTIFSDWPKVEVPGVAYTLIIASPLLPLPYPVLGFMVNGTFAGVALLTSRLPGVGTWALLIGFLAGVVAFFPGLWLEAQASQVALYRIMRTCWRILVPAALAVLASFDETGFRFRPSGASGGMAGAGIVTGLIIHFVCSLLDRLYFPVKAEVLRQRAQLAKGEAPTRGLGKRWLYGWLWLIPVMILCKLAIRLAAEAAARDPEAGTSFMVANAPVVYGFGMVAWFLLCLFGILPGTRKRTTMLIDPNLVNV